ncbi:hypothetical protein NDR87_26940 [Nocardia sp. CDC159]|uniref:DUF8020 domain-containing protein n=1 Tax=Nocardia pulmonis TaxID=2951408 RepID=A0A9X2J0K5_9NOCA|nr:MULTISPECIES: hypothetical protein [Nocardia]MCM6777130.1 hypothetical protein [Nocardia pulmonis]MCM6790015.1 hypothetical protein [Nocardia sp. CDC159]
MMRALTFAVITTCAVAAVGGAAGRAAADPAPESIGYSLRLADRSVVLTVDKGGFVARDGRLELLDPSGATAVSVPLSYRRDDAVYPIGAAIDATTVTLTPDTDPKHAVLAPNPRAGEIAIDPQSPAFNTSVMNFATQLGLGVALGTLLGTAVGAVIGCIAGGALVGAAAAVPTIGVLAVPGFLGGCLVTAAAAGAIGAVVGNVVIGIPVAAVGAWWFFDALRAQAAG